MSGQPLKTTCGLTAQLGRLASSTMARRVASADSCDMPPGNAANKVPEENGLSQPVYTEAIVVVESICIWTRRVGSRARLVGSHSRPRAGETVRRRLEAICKQGPEMSHARWTLDRADSAAWLGRLPDQGRLYITGTQRLSMADSWDLCADETGLAFLDSSRRRWPSLTSGRPDAGEDMRAGAVFRLDGPNYRH